MELRLDTIEDLVNLLKSLPEDQLTINATHGLYALSTQLNLNTYCICGHSSAVHGNGSKDHPGLCINVHCTTCKGYVEAKRPEG